VAKSKASLAALSVKSRFAKPETEAPTSHQEDSRPKAARDA